MTGAFAVPFTAYFLLLSGRVVQCRLRDQTLLGHGGAASSKRTGADDDGPESLLVAARSHANFVEYVPWAFVLSTIVELNGGDKRILGAGLGSLLAFRVLHTEFGLRRPGAAGTGRQVGFFGTVGVLGFFASYITWLVREDWGF